MREGRHLVEQLLNGCKARCAMPSCVPKVPFLHIDQWLESAVTDAQVDGPYGGGESSVIVRRLRVLPFLAAVEVLETVVVEAAAQRQPSRELALAQHQHR